MTALTAEVPVVRLLRPMAYDFPDYLVCVRCRGLLASKEGTLTCSGCGAIFEIRNGVAMLLPAYDEAERKRYLSSYEVLASDDLREPIEAHRDVRHEPLLDFIGNVRGKKVLDIGSSAATYLRKLDAGFKVAFDLAFPYLANIPAESGIGRVCGDAETLPIRPGFFDVIVISDILEHLLHPEALIALLEKICRPDTRVIVHVPWEEDLSAYKDARYEFTHLRKFTPFGFAQYWTAFSVRRRRDSYPTLSDPILFRIRAPRFVMNLFELLYFHTSFHKTEYRWRERWIAQLPRREWWLLWFYAPTYRMFELRLLAGSLFIRFVKVAKRLGRPGAAR